VGKEKERKKEGGGKGKERKKEGREGEGEEDGEEEGEEEGEEMERKMDEIGPNDRQKQQGPPLLSTPLISPQTAPYTIRPNDFAHFKSYYITQYHIVSHNTI
jgi:hypothetical protein